MVGTSGEQSPKVAYLKTRLLVKEFELYPEEWWKPKDDFGQRNGGGRGGGGAGQAHFRKINLESREGLSDRGQLGGSLKQTRHG